MTTREGVILIASSAPAGEHYRQLISRQWEQIERSRVFTVRSHLATFEGLRVKRVYMTPEAVHEAPRQMIDMLIRSMAMTKDREGFFLVQENGDLHGGFNNVASGRDGNAETV